MSKPIVIMNPASGQSRGPVNRELARRLATEYDDELYFTVSAEDALETAARAARERRPLIVAAGGDDTVRQVLAGMYGLTSDLRPGLPLTTVFGVLPTGTFNNFAGHLGVPRDFETAWRVAHEGQLRWVDLGWVDGLLFTESIGVGVDVEAWKGFHESPSMWRRVWDGGLAVVRAIYNYRPRKLDLILDGEPRRVSVLSLTVANSQRFSAAFSIAPHAQPDNGKLDLCILPSMSKLRFLASLPFVFWGKHTSYLPDVVYQQVAEVRISAAKPYAVRVDGRLRRNLPVQVRVLAGALPIRLPLSL